MDRAPWESDDDAESSYSDDSSWRGSEHLEDWPENLAGPEYHLYNAQLCAICRTELHGEFHVNWDGTKTCLSCSRKNR